MQGSRQMRMATTLLKAAQFKGVSHAASHGSNKLLAGQLANLVASDRAQQGGRHHPQDQPHMGHMGKCHALVIDNLLLLLLKIGNLILSHIFCIMELLQCLQGRIPLHMTGPSIKGHNFREASPCVLCGMQSNHGTSHCHQFCHM